MFLKKASGPRTVVLPGGGVLTLADLPAAETRWVASRKAAVVDAVRHGLVTREEALRRWHLSEEELDGWTAAHARHGLAALKVTATQRFRQPPVDSCAGARPGKGSLTLAVYENRDGKAGT